MKKFTFKNLFKKFNLVDLNQFKQDPLAASLVKEAEKHITDDEEVNKSIKIHFSVLIQKLYN